MEDGSEILSELSFWAPPPQEETHSSTLEKFYGPVESSPLAVVRCSQTSRSSSRGSRCHGAGKKHLCYTLSDIQTWEVNGGRSWLFAICAFGSDWSRSYLAVDGWDSLYASRPHWVSWGAVETWGLRVINRHAQDLGESPGLFLWPDYCPLEIWNQIAWIPGFLPDFKGVLSTLGLLSFCTVLDFCGLYIQKLLLGFW